MNRSPFAVAQSPYDLSHDNVFTNCPLSSVVCRLHSRLNDKSEPGLKAVANLAYEALEFLVGVLSVKQLIEPSSRQIPQYPSNFRRRIAFQSIDEMVIEIPECFMQRNRLWNILSQIF